VVEGDLWVYARTDLADFYAGRLTLRQIWVRFSSLPPEANIWTALEPEMKQAEATRKAKSVESSLSQFYATNGGQHA
jgi:hypothetical protein